MGRPSFSNSVLNESGELVSYWTTIPPMTKEQRRWHMVEVYKNNVDASYSCIAEKAKVTYALVARWLPVYLRTGCVVDGTKPGPKATAPKLTFSERYGKNGITPKSRSYKPSWGKHDKLHRIHARERMVEVYKNNQSASHRELATEAGVSLGVVKRWLPFYLRTGCVFKKNEKTGLPKY